MYKKFNVKINGKQFMVEVEQIDEPKKKPINKPSFKLENLINKAEASKSEGAKNDDPNKIFSSLPGNIVKILKKEGDKLSINAPVLVMEAMKMENEITSPANGKLKKIYVSIGQKVDKDELLFEIES
ncbi:MAG TPA: acetyl-CoA carboxylase biotin carboxyl carrier protein subunit [bacterium]|mgnify:CR=1 FL=1|nr:acetyl-CoA carboxylase biotin carboxyl carrier protein subunit [bacterium]